MFKEFREFAMRGNVVDMAVGIIIGAAFGKIVASLVADVIMPPIGMLAGGIDFTNFFVTLSGGSYATLAEAKAAGAVTLNYGLFINTALDFVIVAFAVFMLIRAMNRLRRKSDVAETPPPPANKDCPYCYSTIPIKATRCPSCTSALDGEVAA